MTDNTELKRLAEAAIIARNEYDADECNADLADEQTAADDAFHDAAGPEEVLLLIAENESLRGSCKAMGADMGKLTRERNSFRSQAEKARAEVAGLRTGYEAYEQVNAELKAEVEGLRKDSDKWKIVQRAGDQLLADEGRAAIWSACSRILISVASELNSGRSVVTEEGVTSGGVEIGDWRVTVERIDAALGQGDRGGQSTSKTSQSADPEGSKGGGQ